MEPGLGPLKFCSACGIMHWTKPIVEDPIERGRRLYSSGYYAGQWCAPHRSALDKNRLDYKAAFDDPRIRILGAIIYCDGFEDGWAGRVPLFELRLADLAAYEERVGARP